jgi:zinc transport system ATP-binding protein
MNQPLIRATALSVKRQDRYLVKDASLVLEQGRIVTLIGPNGAGKTTLIRCLLGLINPDEGHIERTPDLRIGYMPQKLHLDTSLPLTVKRFLALGGKPRLKEDEVLSMTGISHLATSPMQRLSGGETQRVLLARALLRDPQLLVLDEPVQGVDVTGQAALYALIGDIARTRGCGVLLVSHDLHLVMATTDTVICLNQHICCSGHPEKVTNDPAYLALFGPGQRPQMAIYTHHHDHSHNDHGDVIRTGHSCQDHSHCEHKHHA